MGNQREELREEEICIEAHTLKKKECLVWKSDLNHECNMV